jgi:hypothetical protein
MHEPHTPVLASVDRDTLSTWPTGWASIIGGLLFALPYLLGVLDGIGVSGAKAPGLRAPALLSMAMGAGLLLIALYGWWALAGPRTLGKAGVAVLAVGYVLWLLDLADNLSGGGVLPFYISENVYAMLVGIGALLFAAGFWRYPQLPRGGLLILGICGPLGMVLLAAPWPLGLGPIVPAVVIIYAIGWVLLGAAVRRQQPDAPASRAIADIA